MSISKPQHHEFPERIWTPEEFAKTLDHSFLKTYFTKYDLDVFCDDMKNYGLKYCSVTSGTVPAGCRIMDEMIRKTRGGEMQPRVCIRSVQKQV